MSRSVLVTGGSRGIGLATARAFAALGDKVAVAHWSTTPPDGFYAVKCDVRSTDSVREAVAGVVAEQGPVQVLVAGAGVTRDTLLMRMADDAWADVLDANLSGAWRVAREVVPGMVRARGGRLLFLSSVVGLLGSAGQANYAASKAALVGFARSLARELGSRNITFNVVAPGFVDTDMTKGVPGLFWLVSPEKAASTSLAIARSGSGRAAFVPARWSLVAWVVRSIPSFLFRRLNF